MATIINHTNCAGLIRSLDKIPSYWIQKAKTELHIAYGTASHGLQVHYGAVCLNSWDGSGLYTFNHGGANGALDWRTWTDGNFGNLGMAMSLEMAYGGAGNRTIWADATRAYLNANPDINVIMWSWCYGANTSPQNIDLYLGLMAGLERDYPNVKFVYMTGHTDGTGLSGNLHIRNDQIKSYCAANNKILYDFEDIESWNPDGVYFGDRNCNANCDYTGGNWALEWQTSHQVGQDWFTCSQCQSCHSQDLNCNLKAVAFWNMAARLVGWNPDIYAIPENRRITWRPGIYTNGAYTGVPETPVGITMQSSNPAGQYYVDATGVADATAAINSAITACPNDTAILLPAGTFRVNSVIQATRGRFVLRGQGAGSTTLMGYNQTGNLFNVLGGGPGSGVAISSGYTKGSSVIVLASVPPGLVVGDYAMVYQTNNDALLGGGTTYMANAISQIVCVSAINGTTITLDRELYYSYDPAYAPSFARMTPAHSVGLEDITLDMTNGLGGLVRWQYVARSWIRKAELKGCGGWNIRLVGSARCDISRNYVHNGRGFASDQAYGIGLYGRCTDNLIEDNRCYYLRHGIILEYGGTGNVIAYNYSDINYDENIPNSTGMQSIHTHGGFQYQNLFEGNVTSQMNFDAYLAQPATRRNTLLRNHSRGYDRPGAGRRFCLEVACHSLEENIVGNVFGIDGDYGIGDYEQVVGDPRDEAVYRLGWWGSIYEGYAYDGVTPLPDVRVKDTIIRHGNYDYMTGQTRYADGEPQTIPSSLYLASKPSWFGILDWPPIGPDVQGYVKDIPAILRWDNYQVSGDLSDMFADITEEEPVAIDKSVVFTVRVLAPEDVFLSIAPVYLEARKPNPLVFTITTTAISGFVGNLSLSLQDIPAGMTAIFSKTVLAATDTATLTLTTDGVNIYDTDFDITLRAVEIV